MVPISRIDCQRRNLLAVAQPEVSPSFARVSGPVNAVANGKIRPLQTLPAGRVDQVRVRWRDRYSANGLRGLFVEDRVPGAAVIVRFPNSSVHLRHVKEIGPAGNTRGRARPA